MSSTRKAIKKRGKNSQKNNREEVQSRRRRAVRKLSHHVTFWIKATDPRREYHLLALLVHMGSGPTQGHYLTVVHFWELWMALNDEQVSLVEQEALTSCYGVPHEIITNTETGYGTLHRIYIEVYSSKPAALQFTPAWGINSGMIIVAVGATIADVGSRPVRVRALRRLPSLVWSYLGPTGDPVLTPNRVRRLADLIAYNRLKFDLALTYPGAG
eukprot:COSAG01_NODE_6491_length_3633_cov_4.622241_1_plen_214_part_00